MEEKIKKLEIQIKGMELERNRLSKAYISGELTESPFKQTHALNSRILELTFKLNDLRSRDPLKYDVESSARPNPVELIATWCEFFEFMALMTWLCGAISMYMYDGNIGFAIFGVGLIVALSMLPSMLISGALGAVRDRFGEILPTYYCSETLFSGGIRRTFRRCYGCNIGVYLTVFIGAMIIIGNLTCLFNPEAFALSFVGLLLLSLGGFFANGARIVVDVVRGVHRARQVF